MSFSFKYIFALKKIQNYKLNNNINKKRRENEAVKFN